MVVYLMRHGEILKEPGKRFIGQTDLSLNDKGLAQAEWWGNKLKAAGLTGIVSSDLQRCRQTAEVIGTATGISISFKKELREIHLGVWENRTMDDIRHRHPDQWAARGADFSGFRPPEGENFSDVRERVMPVFQQIFESPSDRTLVVTHAGVIRVVMCAILDVPLDRLFRFDPPYGALSVLDAANKNIKVKSFGCPSDT